MNRRVWDSTPTVSCAQQVPRKQNLLQSNSVERFTNRVGRHFLGGDEVYGREDATEREQENNDKCESSLRHVYALAVPHGRYVARDW